MFTIEAPSIETGKIDISESRKKLGFSGRFTILFAGTIGKAQALDSIISAARILNTNDNNILFAIIGSGIELQNIKDLSRKYKLSNVKFLPRVPLEEMDQYYRVPIVF